MSKYRITINGNVYEMEIERIEENKAKSTPYKSSIVYSSPDKTPPVVQVIDPMAKKATVYNDSTVYTPMPGTVIKVLPQKGDRIQCGQTVLILEAMKMENEITAPKDGVIKEMFVSEGQTVAGNAVLFEIGDKHD